MYPERKTVAKYSKSVFFEEYNDIDIYIEDTECGAKKIYLEIFKKMFGDEIKINDIYPLGGRVEVVTECKKNKNSSNERKELYLIDGDLYLLTGENLEIFSGIDEIDNLIKLPCYCLENILINENSFLEIMDEENMDLTFSELQEKLKYEEWVNSNNLLFRELYIEFALIKKIKPQLPNVSCKITDLVSSNTGLLNEEKISKKISEISEELKNEVGIELYNIEREKTISKISDETVFMFKYVSGKDHLIPLLLTRIRSIIKFKVPNSIFKLRLAKKIPLSTLENLKNDFFKYIS